MSSDLYYGLSARAPTSLFTSPLSRILWQDHPLAPRGSLSTALNLGTGERLQAFPNMALKMPGSSEVFTSMVDQLKVIIRDQLAEERRDDERKRVARKAVRDAEFQALQTKVNNLDNTIAASVSGSLSMAFNSPAFAQMIAQAVQAGINSTPAASAAQHNGGLSNNVNPRDKE